MEGSKIDFDLKGIGDQLHSRLFAVPLYQRSYSWGPDHLNDYWNDLAGALSREESGYFLGTVVLSGEGRDERVTIIDGQQRLATTSILLAAIRNVFDANNEDNRARHIQNHYLGSYDISTDSYASRLFLNTEDDEYYRQRIVDRDPAASASRPSHHLISQALTFMGGKVEELVDQSGAQWVDRLSKWVEFLDKRVLVIRVEVPTEADAFMIFETLNDRGADLTLADLLKNYLFGRSGNKLDYVRERWLLALGALEMTSEDRLFITFLRHYWSSVHGLVRERELYKSIKSQVVTQTQAVKFSDELQDAARLYAALLSGDHEFWSDIGGNTREHVNTLTTLDVEQNRPLLLAAVQHLDKRELKKVLRVVVSWSVRNLVTGRAGSGTTEKAYSDAAVSIRSGAIKSAQELFDKLTHIIPTDEEFKTSFETVRVTKGALSRYYLLALERTRAEKPEPELVPNSNEEEVNLEHVLPRRAKAGDWPQFTPDERRVFVGRLGNHALLSREPNSLIGNQPFSVKQPVLAASELELTKIVGTQPDWTPQTIEQRQKQLAKLAVRTWKRSP